MRGVPRHDRHAAKLADRELFVERVIAEYQDCRTVGLLAHAEAVRAVVERARSWRVQVSGCVPVDPETETEPAK